MHHPRPQATSACRLESSFVASSVSFSLEAGTDVLEAVRQSKTDLADSSFERFDWEVWCYGASWSDSVCRRWCVRLDESESKDMLACQRVGFKFKEHMPPSQKEV